VYEFAIGTLRGEMRASDGRYKAMMGRAFGGWLGATLVGLCLVGAAGCGSSSNSNNKCTGTTTGGLGGGLGTTMCAAGGTGTGNNACTSTATDTCTVCIDGSCCTQLNACIADTTCANCGDDGTCYESNAAGLALVTCVSNSCNTQCQ
jgi:hypothetical protein